VFGTLIYLYVVVHGLSYISVSLDELDGTTGRNRVALVLVVIGPIIFSHFKTSSHTFGINYILALVSGTVYIAAVLYTQSRGAWFSLIFVGALYAMCKSFHRMTDTYAVGTRTLNGQVSAFVTIIIACSLVAVTLASGGDFVEDIRTRALRSFADSGADASTMARIQYIHEGIAIAAEHPFIGAGPGAILDRVGHVSHNDYIKILAEFGVIGFLLFLLLVTSIWNGWVRLILQSPSSHFQFPLLLSTVLVTVYMIFRNIMAAPMFWVLLGYSVTMVTSKSVYRTSAAVLSYKRLRTAS
jgi:O-antigen ligase